MLANWFTVRAPTLKVIALGFASYPPVFALAWFAWPAAPAIQAPVDRVLLALQLAAVPTVVLHLVLQSLWRIFDTPDAEDPFAGAESRRWKINARVFSNTVEQTLLFVPLLLALAVRIDPAHTKLLPILVLLWTLGRLMFWAGYHVGLRWRAPGMDWTSSTCVVALLWLGSTLF